MSNLNNLTCDFKDRDVKVTVKNSGDRYAEFEYECNYVGNDDGQRYPATGRIGLEPGESKIVHTNTIEFEISSVESKSLVEM